MKLNFKFIASALVIAASGAVMTSCDDWTEPESLDFKYGDITQNPSYAQYLESIRAFKATEHKQVYAWLEIPAEGPLNQSHRLTALPDSIDVVVLVSPETVNPTIIRDMEQVKDQKGIKTIYCIDFDLINSDYTLLCEQLAAERATLKPDENGEIVVPDELKDPDFNDYMLEKLTAKLDLVDTAGFDGVMFAYNGRGTSHLSPAALSQYKQRQRLFMGAAADWHKRFPAYSFDYLGYPQFLEDKDALADFGKIFLRQGLNATNADLFTYYLTMASGEGIPAEKLCMMTTVKSNDALDTTTGVFSNGTYAIASIGSWGFTHSVAGIGIQNVQNDYFNKDLTYPSVRAAIQALNGK